MKTSKSTQDVNLLDIEAVVSVTEEIIHNALDTARALTSRGAEIDRYQVHCERLAHANMEAAVARSLLNFAKSMRALKKKDDLLEQIALVFSTEVLSKLRYQIENNPVNFGVNSALMRRAFGANRIRILLRNGLNEERIQNIGQQVIKQNAANNSWIENRQLSNLQSSMREFAETEIEPLATAIHRNNDLIPESLIQKMSARKLFGISIPESYGGNSQDYQTLLVVTEELSRISMPTAGSIITRAEILIKALLHGGTEAQKKKWLPLIASGQLIAAIAVTEPEAGSDVASISCRAAPVFLDGREGFLIQGQKSWCTCAGRANVLAVLARTDPNFELGARGLTLFIIEKDVSFDPHFEIRQPLGGSLIGQAEPTPGYRGLRSFNLSFTNYFVPKENVVGEEAGLGNGFYLQMKGFAAGRLQTAARAIGLAQGALETTVRYVTHRRQFGSPLANFQLTQYKIGWMAVRVSAARLFAFDVAKALDLDSTQSLQPAMAKVFATDMAVLVTREGQLLHGGWGYSEVSPISRFVLDAMVMPLFEGVNPVLELKVIARNLLKD